MYAARQTRFLRLLALIETGPIEECWAWRGYTNAERRGWFGRQPAYRALYEYVIGEIPQGATLDHLCDNPNCVNPNHLAIASMRANVLRNSSPPSENARKTHCKRGHPFNVENTYWRKDGRGRICRKCRVIRQTEYLARTGQAHFLNR